MPCILALIAAFFPRLVIIALFLFSDYLGRAYSTVLWPILGFLFAPFTTLAYAFGKNSNGSIDGWYLVIVIVAILMDLGSFGGSASSGRKFKSKSKD